VTRASASVVEDDPLKLLPVTSVAARHAELGAVVGMVRSVAKVFEPALGVVDQGVEEVVRLLLRVGPTP